MFTTLLSATLILSAALRGVVAFDMETPSLVQCKETSIKWSATTGPYNVLIVPAENVCAEALAEPAESTQDNFVNNYKVPLKSGTKVQISVMDENEEEAWSAIIEVGPSDDESCLPKSQQTPPPPASSTATSSTTTSTSSTLPINTPSSDNTNTTPVNNAGTSPSDPPAPAVAVGGLNGGIVGGSGNGASSAYRFPTAAMLLVGFSAYLAL